MFGVRSKTGCWTCRLRRKKCDEARPKCHTCTFRNVTCNGYGPRPHWMDGRDLEEAELVKIRAAVSQSYRIRRALHITSRHEGLQPPAFRNNDLRDAPELMSDRLGSNNANTFKRPLVEAEHRGGSGQLHADNSKALLQNHHNGSKVNRSSQSNIVLRNPSGHSKTWMPGPIDISYNQDLGKIMYFFDHVFPLQHPFYRVDPSVPNQEREWLLSMLLRTNHYRLSALAMSALHHSIFVDNGNAEQEKRSILELQEYHSLTMQALQQQLSLLFMLNGSSQLKVGLGLLASIIQLVSFEVFRESKPFKGDVGSWEVHLDGAQVLLDMIYFSTNTSTLQMNLASPVKQSHHLSTWKTANFLASEDFQSLEMIGLNFLTAVYVWADVCRCASMGWHYSTGQIYPYKKHLEEERINLSSVMGCRNWAMCSIMDIAQLEAWKNECQSIGTYRVAEGNRRGNFLERRLIAGLRQTWPISVSLTLDDRDKNLITCAHGICALIYLHIIIFDAGPSLPRIQDYVKRVIVALEAISPYRLRSVSWPFCVAGCMAIGKDRNSFRQIVQSVSETKASLGTIWSSMAIIEESWKLAFVSKDESEKDAVCWRTAMDSLGARILLI